VAEHHFKIKKDARAGRTTSRVVLLEGDERIDEIASMIDGEPPSATSRKGAREMLERAGSAV
jgi:DNA repair protein RecN (Recombination protein N)